MKFLAMLSCVLLMWVTAGAQAPVVNDVLAAQVMLDRLGFSTGEIDGRMGTNVRRALNAFQMAQGMPASNAVDPATWKRLSEQTGGQPPLISYTVADADVAGPFTADIPADLMEQSKLQALNYRTPLEALAEKFHASPDLLRQINPRAAFDRAGEQILVPNVTPFVPPQPEPPATAQRGRPVGTAGRGAPAARGGRGAAQKAGAADAGPAVTIIVTKETSALTVEDESGTLLFHAPVTSGSEHDPLPIGMWKVTKVYRMPPFHYNPALFWDADPRHAKAKIPPGPNNPVGVVWIDLTKEHYGIHGTPEPSNIGHVESHGCVRLTNWDAARVAEWARPGTPVIFR
jgi:lipoprotein-anchoring transpeptidase ErfK/SrfK